MTMAFPPVADIGQWVAQTPTPRRWVSIVILSATVFLACLLLVKSRRRSARAFTNDRGERLPRIEKDVRFMKFLRSRELSQMAQDLSGTAPCLIRSGPYQELLISQPDHIHEFYTQDYKRHTKPRNLNLGELFGCLMPGAVGGQFGDDWRKIRSHFDPPMAFHPVAQRIPRFIREIKTWTQTLPTGDVSSRSTFRFIVFRLLALHLYEDAFDDRMYWRMLELYHLHEEVVRAAITSIDHWHDSKLFNKLPVGPIPKSRRFRREWRDFNRTVVENAKGGRWTCPVEVIYRGVNPKQDMTEEAFLSTLGEILFTNVDISTQVLGTIFTNLAAHPHVQNALRTEIQDQKSTRDAYLPKSDTLLHRVLLESMRFSPALWFSMPETTADDKTIGGYHIPANTAVVIDTRRLNNNAVTWGPKGDAWDPDRFLHVASTSLRCGFMRFGVGAASGRCLGKNVADVIFKLTIIAVVEQFALEPLATEGGKGNHDLRLVPL